MSPLAWGGTSARPTQGRGEATRDARAEFLVDVDDCCRFTSLFRKMGWLSSPDSRIWAATEAGALDVLARAVAGTSRLGEAPLPARVPFDREELGNAFEQGRDAKCG